MDASIELFGLSLHRIGAADVVRRVMQGLREGRGGWVLTPNVELVQQASEDDEIRALYGRADLRVADGVPLLWLARLAGRPFPERVAGSDLVWLLAEAAAAEGRRLFLLGGEEGVASAAAALLEGRYPGLRVCGHLAPDVALPLRDDQVSGIRRELERTQPDLVFVALGSPKTEYLIDALRSSFPGVWWQGCGISLSFMTGHVARAPAVVQRLGFEWLHRLLQEPRRLGGRYLGRNLPFLVRGLRAACRSRSRGGPIG